MILSMEIEKKRSVALVGACLAGRQVLHASFEERTEQRVQRREGHQQVKSKINQGRIFLNASLAGRLLVTFPDFFLHSQDDSSGGKNTNNGKGSLESGYKRHRKIMSRDTM
jgi:hypothetical protein